MMSGASRTVKFNLQEVSCLICHPSEYTENTRSRFESDPSTPSVPMSLAGFFLEQRVNVTESVFV